MRFPSITREIRGVWAAVRGGGGRTAAIEFPIEAITELLLEEFPVLPRMPEPPGSIEGGGVVSVMEVITCGMRLGVSSRSPIMLLCAAISDRMRAGAGGGPGGGAGAPNTSNF